MSRYLPLNSTRTIIHRAITMCDSALRDIKMRGYKSLAFRKNYLSSRAAVWAEAGKNESSLESTG